MIGKRKASRYEPGKRSGAWLKVKAFNSADFVIGGYTKGKGSRAPLGSVLVGTWEGKKLLFASHVGSGFDDASLPALKARLEKLESKTCPFAEKPELHSPTTWVEPEFVAEVKFQSWTDDGHLRAPVFLRLRDDVDAKSVRRIADPPGDSSSPARSSKKAKPEANGVIDDVVAQLRSPKASLTLAVGAAQVKLTHLDRVYWPADPALKQPPLTKRHLLRYLAQVSPFMLPHLADRPLTMIRMPDGIDGQRFFQKHWEQSRPDFVGSIVVYSEHKDESHEYLLCNNLPTLLWLAQSGTLEFHVWHSRAQDGQDTTAQAGDYGSSIAALEASVLNFPDYVVFDIDPYIYSGKEKAGDEPELNTIAFEKGKEVAFRLRELLQSMSLEPIVKTSGKTGLHVFVPIARTMDFDQARKVSELVGRHLMKLHPRDITMEWSVPKRTGKIFMDYNMNVRGKTLNVAYSPRGVTGAPVSMPLTWDELQNAHPLDFRLTNAAQRLAVTGDRWRDALTSKQSLERALGPPGGKSEDLQPVKELLAEALFHCIPAGVGSTGKVHLDRYEMQAMLAGGAKWAVGRGYGTHEDLEFIEERGCMADARPENVSDYAKKRQQDEMGTLGSGNHYLEVQQVVTVFDAEAASIFGLHEGDIVVSIHCGSRGLGHQTGTDFLKSMVTTAAGHHIELPDRELACAPINSEVGREYLGAMRSAINCALANHI